MSEKIVRKIGWVAAVMTIVMFSSYIDQIRLNLQGSPGSIVLPIATIFNCLSWMSYAVLKEKIDWPILICNLVGVVLAALTVLTFILVW